VPTGPALICPQGHASEDPDWCDVCGLALAPRAAPTSVPSSAPGRASTSAPTTGPPPAARRCALCGTELDGRFCETCGHDSEATVVPAMAPVDRAATPPDGPAVTPPRAPASTWQAVVRADRAWFDEVRRQQGLDAATLEFPRYAIERRFALAGAQVAIGRRSASRGTTPEIDLTGLDPGVSAAHALLVARPGGWGLVDVGSTNGTTLAIEDGPIPPHQPVPLTDGAVVRLGAWTTITLTANPPVAR